MTIGQQTLVLLLAVIVIMALFTFFVLTRISLMIQSSERAAREWYRLLVVREYDRIAGEDVVIQNEMRALTEEVHSLVLDVSEHLTNDAIDTEAHLARLDSLAEQERTHTPRTVVLPPA